MKKVSQITSKDINTNFITQLIKSIRKDKSQGQINLKLNIDFNQVAKWESGKKIMTWDDFVDYSKACNIPLYKRMNSVFDYKKRKMDSALVFKHLTKSLDKDDLCKKLNYTPKKLKRRNEGIGFTLQEFSLMIYHFYPTAFYIFFYPLCNGYKVNLFKKYHLFESTLKDLSLKHPEVLILIRIIDSEIYQGSEKSNEEFFQDFFQLQKSEVESMLADLVQYGLCSISKKNKKLRSRVPIFQYHLRDQRLKPGFELIHDQVHKAFLDKINNSVNRKLNLTGFRVGAVSDEVLNQIEFLSKKYFYEIGRVMTTESEGPKNNVFVQTLGVVSIENGID